MWVSCRCCKEKYEVTKDTKRYQLDGYEIVVCPNPECKAEHYIRKLKKGGLWPEEYEALVDI